MRPRPIGIAALAAAAAVCGCGGSDSPPAGPATKVSQVVDDLQARASSGDAQGICDHDFTAALRQLVARTSGKSCVDYVKASLIAPYGKIAVDGISISIDRKLARVRLRDANNASNTLNMNDADGWRVDSIVRPGSGRQP